MTKPNIIMIIAEELGHDFIGYAGNQDCETPFLDELSGKSVTFCNHFTVHGKCVPSRVALYSGRYCHNGGHRTLGIELQPGEISLAAITKANGYHNILIGKNHTIDNSILMEQFDEHWQGGTGAVKAVRYADYNDETTSNDRSPGNPCADNYLFGKLNVNEDQVIDYVHTKRLCNFLETADHTRPFFINLNYSYTHPPYEIMEPYYSRFMDKDLKLFPAEVGSGKPEFMYQMSEMYGFDRLTEFERKEMLACYYGQLAFVDARVKEIYQCLQDSNLLDNTILIFTADHGDLVGQHCIPEKWDTVFSDSIMKIPLMIHYPASFNPHCSDAMTENIDILPTLLEMTGIDKPYGIQGKSLLPILESQTDSHKDYVFAEGGHEKELLDIEIAPDEHRLLIVGYLKKAEMREVYPDSLRKAKMIRTSGYKLVYRIKDRNELYDLQKDPLEQINLYDKPEYRELVQKMEKMLLDHLIESEDNLPFDPCPIS